MSHEARLAARWGHPTQTAGAWRGIHRYDECMSTSTDIRHDLRAPLTFALCALTLASGSGLEAQQDREFREERRITAIDLVLGFEAGAFREWATDNPVPKDLGPQDFEIFHDGEPRRVVAIEPTAGEWQIVIYFDAALTSSAGLRWAAAALAGRGDELTALGEVTIIVADPAPRTLLPPTRDRDRLNASLSQLARFQEGRDELMALRAQAVRERRAGVELDAELMAAVAAEEARMVRARHDDLLLELVTREGPGPHRALLFSSGGYDLDPGEFYRSLVDGSPVAGPQADLATATEAVAHTLAAYGWITVPLLPPEDDPLKEGVRIGKFRLTGPSVTVEDQRTTPTDWEEYSRTVIWMGGAKLEGQRKPKRAEAYLELGTALHAQGKLAEAEDALRQAIYHFAGHPKTAERQALAFARLGAVLEAREETQEANAAFRLARRLDPDVTVGAAGDTGPGGPIAALLSPSSPLERLAQATSGSVVRGAKDLARALEGLRRRVRLTYQVAGLPDGVLHTLEARYQGSRQLIYPGWARSSTPESVAAAKTRRLLAGEPTGGGMALDATFVARAGGHRRGEIDLTIGPPETAAGAASETALRLSIGVGGPDVDPTVEHRRLGSQTGAAPWSYRVGFEMPEDRSWLAVLVEDLETGAWGGRLIETP